MQKKNTVKHPKSDIYKNMRKIIFLLLMFTTFFFLQHSILKIQKKYHLNIGVGDQDYFTTTKKAKFGLKQGEVWVRPMGRHSFINLPIKIEGEKVQFSFWIKSCTKTKNVLIYNNKKEVIGSLTIPAGKDWASYRVILKTSQLPGRIIDIKLGNAAGRLMPLDLTIDRLDIEIPEGGVLLPLKFDFLFVAAVVGFFVVLLTGGLSLKWVSLAASVLSITAIIGKYLDCLVYIQYLKTFVCLCLPFLLISALIIRLFKERISEFKDEKSGVLVALVALCLLIHFIGLFYPYHINIDGRDRISFYRILQNKGLPAFFEAMSRHHARAVGAEKGSIPYPPWYNLLAMPFIKLGIEDHTWLRFQYLALTSFFPLLIYLLAKTLGANRNSSRIAAFLSIFTVGILRDFSYFAYDTGIGFIFLLVFFILLFKKTEKLSRFRFKDSLKYGIALGLVLPLHPCILLTVGAFFGFSLLLTLTRSSNDKWNCFKTQITISLIGFSISLVLFYGIFFWEVITVTIPSALSNNAFVMPGLPKADNFAYMLITHPFKRILWTFSAAMLPFFIWGIKLILDKAKKEKKRWLSLFILAWLISYGVLILFRTPGLLFNFLKHIPEYNYIYPLYICAVAIAIERIWRGKKVAIILKYLTAGLIMIYIVYNLFWFYLIKIDMASSELRHLEWLRYIF